MKRLEKRKQKESKRQEHITIKLLLILAILEVIDKLLDLLLKLKQGEGARAPTPYIISKNIGEMQ